MGALDECQGRRVFGTWREGCIPWNVSQKDFPYWRQVGNVWDSRHPHQASRGHTSNVVRDCCLLFSCPENNSELLGLVKPWVAPPFTRSAHWKGVVVQSNGEYLPLPGNGIFCPSSTSQDTRVTPSGSRYHLSPALWSPPGRGGGL